MMNVCDGIVHYNPNSLGSLGSGMTLTHNKKHSKARLLVVSNLACFFDTKEVIVIVYTWGK